MRTCRFFPQMICLLVAAVLALPAMSQNITFKREQAERILDDVASDVRQHYYDPRLHGVDWDAKLVEAKQKIEKATSRNLAFANIAAMLDSLNDSHTRFIPPPRSFTLDYGWRIQMLGDRCFVVRVRPQTDASTKVRPGDEVLLVNGYRPTRDNIERMEYVLNSLRPQSKIEVSVRSLAGEERKLEILPKIFQGQLVQATLGDMRLAWETEHKRARPRLVPLSEDVLLARIPEFAFSEEEAAKLINAANKHKTVILDLRGNPGGYEDSLKFLVSGLFDHEVKIADAVTRRATKPRVAKPNHRPFSGKLLVLVDTGSMSAAELFARVVQLEKRGSIIGDRTLGMVMEAQWFGYASASTVFGISVTTANMIMTDGTSLEHVGVTPDQLRLPTAEDLAQGRDPVLAYAAELAGAKLTAEDAAKLLPYEWEQPASIAGH